MHALLIAGFALLILLVSFVVIDHETKKPDVPGRMDDVYPEPESMRDISEHPYIKDLIHAQRREDGQEN
jgi:hypothetical protein